MHYYRMKQHAAAAFFQVVQGCDCIIYDADWFEAKDYPVDLVSMRGKEVCIAVDLAEKFSGYPKEMKQSTLKRKLIRRYLEIHENLAGGAQRLSIELWYFGTAPERVETVMMDVLDTLKREHGITVKVVSSEEIRKRLQEVEQRVRQSPSDSNNPFLQAILISSGHLDRPRPDATPMPTEFAFKLPDARAIPEFVVTFLDSAYVVNWLGFDVSAFDLLKGVVEERRGQRSWWELGQRLGMGFYDDEGEDGEEEIFLGDEEFDDWEFDDEDILTKYSLGEIVDVLEWILENPTTALRGWRADWDQPLCVDIEYMLPFLFKHPRFPPEVIEAEIVRFGGDRDLVRTHLQTPSPDKRCYRGKLCIAFSDRDDELQPTPNSAVIVPVKNPHLKGGIKVAVWLEYPKEFAGYFAMTFDALASKMRTALEKKS